MPFKDVSMKKVVVKTSGGLTEKRARRMASWAEAFFCLGFLVTFGPSQK
jgi:hypothetical protein